MNFDWNGNGKSDAFDNYMDMKVSGSDSSGNDDESEANDSSSSSCKKTSNTTDNKELKGISEAIRYSDNSVLVGNERELLKKLEELKDDLTDISSEDDIRTKINEINVLIKSRNVYLKQNRRGNF